MVIANGADRRQFGIQFTVLASVPQFPLPDTVPGNAVPHGFIKRFVLSTRLQKTRVSAKHFLFTVARHAGKCRVDVDDITLGVTDGYAVVAVHKYFIQQ